MKYTSTNVRYRYIITPETFWERIQLAWSRWQHPDRFKVNENAQVEITFNDAGEWFTKNCRPIMNETKNLNKLRE